MTTYPNIGLTLPTRGAAGSGHWADVLDANTALLDGHDHTSGKGVRITPAAISINADLSFNTSWAVTALNRATFASVAAPGVNKSVFVSDGSGGLSSGELYWTTGAGNNVKITNGNALNVGAFVGGIGGDYQAVSAQLNYDDSSSKRYTFKQGGGSLWAKLHAGALRLTEFSTSETVFVEQLCPAALAVTYAVTWPTALPGSTVLQQIDNTGQIIWSSTIQALTLDTNQNITLQGTGEVKHGNWTITVPAGMGNAVSGTFTRGVDGIVTSTSSGTWYIPIQLPAGARVQSATLAAFGDGAVDAVLSVIYTSKTASTSTKATANITNAPASWNDTTATAGAPAAMAAGDVCHVLVAPNATGLAFNNIRLVFDLP